MTDQAVPALAQRMIWQCSWNWCPESFRERTDLMAHLNATHFNNILKVKTRDWEAYLRSTEGKSGLTDNLSGLQYPSSQSSTSSSTSTNIESSVNAPTPTHDKPSVPSLPLSATPPSIPALSRNVRARGSAAAESSSQHSTGVAPQNPSHPPTTEGPSPAKRRRTSFANCAAQSSPMSTPSVASIPSSPVLSNMITDAINRAAQLNSQSPHRDNSLSTRRRKPISNTSPLGNSWLSGSLRRTSTGASPSPSQGPSRALPPVPVQPSPLRLRKSLRAPASPMSVGSAQAVEDALTQTFSKSPSAPLSRTASFVGRAIEQGEASGETSSSLPSSSQPGPVSQDSSEPQPQSYCGGSHAVESIPTYTPSGSIQPTQTQPSLPQPQPQSQVSPGPLILPRVNVRKVVSPPAPIPLPPTYPPLPRRTLRSRTPSGPSTSSAVAAPPPLANTGTTRTLRSRSNSNANSNAGTSTRGGSKPPTRGGSKPPARGGSKPPSKRRAGSKQPASANGADAGTSANATGGLDAVPEQADESQPRADAQVAASGKAAAAAASTSRSGTLKLARGLLMPPQASQAQAQAARSEVAVKREEIEIAMAADSPLAEQPTGASSPSMHMSQSQTPSQAQTESQSGGYSEGFGFDLGGIQLLTQKPYPSQSWDSSQ